MNRTSDFLCNFFPLKCEAILSDIWKVMVWVSQYLFEVTRQSEILFFGCFQCIRSGQFQNTDAQQTAATDLEKYLDRTLYFFEVCFKSEANIGNTK